MSRFQGSEDHKKRKSVFLIVLLLEQLPTLPQATRAWSHLTPTLLQQQQQRALAGVCAL